MRKLTGGTDEPFHDSAYGLFVLRQWDELVSSANPDMEDGKLSDLYYTFVKEVSEEAKGNFEDREETALATRADRVRTRQAVADSLEAEGNQIQADQLRWEVRQETRLLERESFLIEINAARAAVNLSPLAVSNME